jgi:hypothetical protein
LHMPLHVDYQTLDEQIALPVFRPVGAAP